MSKRTTVITASVLIVTTVTVVVWLMLSRLAQPMTGRVVVNSAHASTTSFTINLTPTRYTGHTFQFDYPLGLQPRAPSPLVGPDIEKASFLVRDVMTWNLEIDVADTGQQPLSGDASYRFRKQHPTIYQPSTQIINGHTVVVMTDTTATGFSKVAFLQQADKRATVALQGDDASGIGPLQTTFTMVLTSWHWR